MKHFLFFIIATTTLLLFINSRVKAQLQQHFFNYSIQLTSAEPCSLDETNKNIYQPYPMPPGNSQVSFKYTLQNSIATIQGKLTAQLNGIDLLFPVSNIVNEM